VVTPFLLKLKKIILVSGAQTATVAVNASMNGFVVSTTKNTIKTSVLDALFMYDGGIKKSAIEDYLNAYAAKYSFSALSDKELEIATIYFEDTSEFYINVIDTTYHILGQEAFFNN
jgi:hypothetical protein